MSPSDTPKCDIVLPVHNGLSYLKDCLSSLHESTNPGDYRLFIIDDHSDSGTRDYLRHYGRECLHVKVHRNPENMGFVKSCNLGISMGEAPYVLLLNSDVVLTPGWLDRLLKCMGADPRIASVNPLTNHASQIDLPLVAGANFLGMDEALRSSPPKTHADVVTGVGFCLLLRRQALEEVGLLDEIFGKGYCEDSDLCMRLVSAGWRTVVAKNVYVYHRGRTSFRNRDKRYRHNRRIFDARWATEYERQFGDFIKARSLDPVRHRFSQEKRWDPLPALWVAGRKIIAHWRNKDALGMIENTARGVFRIMKARRMVTTPESVAKVTRKNRLRVTYVIHKLVIAGGVLSVIQLVNELILLGVEARIATLFEDPAIYDWTRLYAKPMVFRNPKDLVANLPETDIAIATLWNTAPWVKELVEGQRASRSVYFVQDYEPWFFARDQKGSRKKVEETYGLIENKIVKSEWLREKMAGLGFSAEKIPLGMDLGCFYPRDITNKGSGPTIIAMVRPRTPRRGFRTTVEALKLVKAALPSARIVFFGDRFLGSSGIPFDYVNEGVITDRDRLARLYSEADIFLDASDFQGFGRCSLEAMACGTACVLTYSGGVKEYARDGENSLLVPPRRPEITARAILKILHNQKMREFIVENGLATSQLYCHKREAKETLTYFNRIVGKGSQCPTYA